MRCAPYIAAATVAIWPLSGLWGAGAGAIGAALGAYTAHRLARRGSNGLKIVFAALAIVVIAFLVEPLPGASAALVRLAGPGHVLVMTDMICWGLFAFGVALALRTLTLRYIAFALLEGACLVTAVTSSFRGHRQYAYSQPQSLADWAFAGGYDPRHWIVAIGVMTLAGLALLLFPRQNVARTLLTVLLLVLALVFGPRIAAKPIQSTAPDGFQAGARSRPARA